MEGWMILFFVPSLAFICLVAPIWIYMHYRSKQQSQGALSEAEREQMEELSGKAVRMLERIETLEAILDQEAPGWRRGSGAEDIVAPEAIKEPRAAGQ